MLAEPMCLRCDYPKARYGRVPADWAQRAITNLGNALSGCRASAIAWKCRLSRLKTRTARKFGHLIRCLFAHRWSLVPEFGKLRCHETLSNGATAPASCAREKPRGKTRMVDDTHDPEIVLSVAVDRDFTPNRYSSIPALRPVTVANKVQLSAGCWLTSVNADPRLDRQIALVSMLQTPDTNRGTAPTHSQNPDSVAAATECDVIRIDVPENAAPIGYGVPGLDGFDFGEQWTCCSPAFTANPKSDRRERQGVRCAKSIRKNRAMWTKITLQFLWNRSCR